MTLQDFTRDIVPILQLLVSVLGLISLFLLWGQIRQKTLWNKLRTQQTFLSHITLELQQKLQQAAKKVNVTLKARVEPLSESEIQRIWDDDAAYLALSRFLNDLETTCTAIHIGIVDPEVAYSSHGIRVTRYYKVYSPVIKKLRAHYNSEDILAEFQKLAEEWMEKERQIENERKSIERRITQQKGAIRKRKI
jgi:hypothetical protein